MVITPADLADAPAATTSGRTHCRPTKIDVATGPSTASVLTAAMIL